MPSTDEETFKWYETKFNTIDPGEGEKFLIENNFKIEKSIILFPPDWSESYITERKKDLLLTCKFLWEEWDYA